MNKMKEEKLIFESQRMELISQNKKLQRRIELFNNIDRYFCIQGASRQGLTLVCPA